MREILFRGQTRRYGEKVRMGDGEKLPSRWVYGGVLQGIGDFSIIYGGENPDDPSDGMNKWAVYTDTLGQYTGLTDKNGKRIFEGDILKDKWGRIEMCIYMESRRRIMFSGSNYSREMENSDESEYEVIGNIHDNPELVKEETT